MLVILTSAKTMTAKSSLRVPEETQPRFRKEAAEIALYMSQYSKEELEQLLHVNAKLALENYHRFQEFHSEETPSLQAILAYTGIVFKRINPKDFNEEDFLYAQEHLRIASICYGLLRPLDRIKTYRMEYDINLPELGEGNMYPFWRPKQTRTLIEDVKAAGNVNVLVNLASQEIQPAFDWKQVEESVRVITPEFKTWKNGEYKTVVIYTKMARGEMTRFILKNRITEPEALKSFRWGGFMFNDSLSVGDNWVFTQE